MVIKKALATLAILSLLIASSPCSAWAAGSLDSAATIQVEQAHAVLPGITAYLQLDNQADFDAASVQAALGDTPLMVKGVTNFSDSNQGVLYMFLVDCSTSISGYQMSTTKQALTDFRASMGGKDKFVLISFGESINVMLDGSEDTDVAYSAINGLKANQSKTLFYDAIDRAIQLSGNQTAGYPKRKVAIVISDGIDYNEGGFTKEEISSSLQQGGLPIYALGFDTGGKDSLDSFGVIARDSGGQIAVVSPSDLESNLQSIQAYIQNSKVVELETPNNIVSNDIQTLDLKVTAGNKTIEKLLPIIIRDWMPKTTSPLVTSIVQNGDSGVTVTFSEPVLGANNKDNYLVKDDSGKGTSIQGVEYSEIDGQSIATLTFNEKPYSGTYTIDITGVTDVSMETNALTGQESFRLDGQPIALKYLQVVFFDFWWALVIIALLILALVAYQILKKRKGLVKVEGQIGFGDMIEYQQHFATPETKPISLIVTDMQGKAQQVDLDVNKSFFVGRAASNNLSFDDIKLSRQHFVIEAQDDRFFITDLETTNGTFVNGVQLHGRRKLEDNDVITAGHEKFILKSSEKGR